LLYVGVGFEEAESTVLRTITKQAMTVFDVGANVGVHTVVLAKIVGPNGRVFSFEPCPTTAAYLRANVQLNELSNVEVVSAALSDVGGEVDFFVFDDGNDVYNSLGAQVRPVEGLRAKATINVRAITLDVFCKSNNIEHIDVLKLDVEGAEEKVINGGMGIIGRSRDLAIVAEVCDRSAVQCGCSSRRLVQHLIDMGFKAFRIGPDVLTAVAGLDSFIPGSYVFSRSTGRLLAAGKRGLRGRELVE
jgi:FkbM family methyltransferase